MYFWLENIVYIDEPHLAVTETKLRWVSLPTQKLYWALHVSAIKY